MKKILYYALFIILFFVSTNTVFASFGQVRYEITNVLINNSKITFRGYAFIHKTHNFVTVKDSNNKTIDVYNANGKIEDGDQKVLIRAMNDGKIIETKVFDKTSKRTEDYKDYNFYCQMYFKGNSLKKECVNAYLGKRMQIEVNKKLVWWPNCTKFNDGSCRINTCGNSDNGENADCYYEDIYFEITFDVTDEEWSDVTEEDVYFEIAVSNADFEKKVGNNYSVDTEGGTKTPLKYLNDTYTEPERIHVGNFSGVVGNSNDYIKIKTETLDNFVKFVATDTIVMNDDKTNAVAVCYGNGSCEKYLGGKTDGTEYKIQGLDTDPKKQFESRSGIVDEPLKYTYTPGMYTIFAKDNGDDIYLDSCDGTGCTVYVVWGSWIKFTGSSGFTIIPKKDKKCDVVPSPDKGIACNNNKTFSSDCTELTVNTSLGKTTVSISQTGTVSSVLAPTSIFQGGGLNFGILYYNTISWNYVSGQPGDAVVKEMQNKLKSYSDYTTQLKITELKIDKKTYDDGFLYKECYTSDEKDNWNPGTELTVSCVFYFPKVNVGRNGDVSYSNGMIGNGISNKFYTPIDFIGKYNITANIVGMNRIKDDVTKKDSKDRSKPWTGKWEDEFNECSVDVYPLFYTGGNTTNSGALNYKFVYRPIDITNPFPNRAAGINWFDWWSIESNRNRLKNTYKDLDYSIGIDNDMISKIKAYNKKQNGNGGYLDWYTMNGDESSFLREYFGVGGN